MAWSGGLSWTCLDPESLLETEEVRGSKQPAADTRPSNLGRQMSGCQTDHVASPGVSLCP
jgi:hypothetical protein